eukprot:Gregarina_sp_Poly_1__4721@NODE_2520_length_2035_cov_1111_986280_g1602_i0_p1_GENE_NODE_2520_length_2035_cov_1111_986280_g1602_i0NODE_2520_length_2035_cov_1111_986280_g1602_i0_p1_ORF_typecomplete_len439_score64_75Peptidase_M24/PF00557_24/1e39_NODE_2520_length_2035_cov_1111_986280_g1602_i05911907
MLDSEALSEVPHDSNISEEAAKVCEEKAANKKKKRSSKKKKLAEANQEYSEQSNSHLRLVDAWPACTSSRQTNPPTVPVDKCFHKGSYPRGEILEHSEADGVWRMSSAECKAKEVSEEPHYDDIRRAAEAHRQTRKYIQELIKPGMTTLEVVQLLEAKSLEMISAKGLESGFAFPTGISINHCAAHYTPNYGEAPVILKHDDVVKIDFGIHVGGRLVDSAFTVAFDKKYDTLLQASKDGTNCGLKAAGVDARFSEVGAAIEEAIRSYEIELNGKMIPIKPIENLNGHTVDLYRVHGGKSVPIVRTDTNDRMEEGEVYAIETFASTGKGKVWDEGVCSHYMLNYERVAAKDFRMPKQPAAQSLYKGIQEHFGTLAWCRRWLDDHGFKRHLLALKNLVDEGIVDEYRPLCDVEGCYTSQWEHTVILRPTCKEIVTRGPDY